MFLFQTKSYLSLCVLTLLAFSSRSFADDSRNVFLSWLAAEDKPFSDEIINRTSQKFREHFGIFQSRYANNKKTEWSPAFLTLAEQTFEEKTGKTISEFSKITNNQMKEGISSSVSRFASPSQEKFGDIFSEYLSSNLKLAKSGRELTTSEANQETWQKNTRVGALESMGGNAGPGAIAINFLVDKQGRIVFVGNIQDSTPDIRDQFHRGRLKEGTVRYAVDHKVWQLFTPANLEPKLKDQLVQDLTRFNGAPPQLTNESFRLHCDIALKKLLGR